jgi:hypothetical protein
MVAPIPKRCPDCADRPRDAIAEETLSAQRLRISAKPLDER